MRRSVLATIAVAVVVLSASAASADPLVGQTNLTIHRTPPGQVNAGDSITIFGKLVGYPPCRPGQSISLIQVGTGTVDTTTTDGGGNYSFAPRVVNGTTSFQTQFDGATIGTHPNEQVCAASVSPVLKVKVKGDTHGAATKTKVLGEHGSLTSGRTAFAGGNLAAVAAILVTLLLAGLLALMLARRPSRRSG